MISPLTITYAVDQFPDFGVRIDTSNDKIDSIEQATYAAYLVLKNVLGKPDMKAWLKANGLVDHQGNVKP